MFHHEVDQTGSTRLENRKHRYLLSVVPHVSLFARVVFAAHKQVNRRIPKVDFLFEICLMQQMCEIHLENPVIIPDFAPLETPFSSQIKCNLPFLNCCMRKTGGEEGNGAVVLSGGCQHVRRAPDVRPNITSAPTVAVRGLKHRVCRSEDTQTSTSKMITRLVSFIHLLDVVCCTNTVRKVKFLICNALILSDLILVTSCLCPALPARTVSSDLI